MLNEALTLENSKTNNKTDYRNNVDRFLFTRVYLGCLTNDSVLSNC